MLWMAAACQHGSRLTWRASHKQHLPNLPAMVPTLLLALLYNCLASIRQQKKT